MIYRQRVRWGALPVVFWEADKLEFTALAPSQRELSRRNAP